MSKEPVQNKHVDLAAEIVSAYVSKNAVKMADLRSLIATVHSALKEASQGEKPTEELKAAVPINKSITPDYLICLEDGRKFRSLKRHLSTAYAMTPDEYRGKWGLGDDYPMVSPRYSEARSTLAKRMGLGQKRRTSAKRSRKAA